MVFWEVQETNPDLCALKMEYKTADGYWFPVTVVPAMVGQGQFPSPHNGPITVRMRASDLAGNQAEASAEVNRAQGRRQAAVLTTTSMQMPSGGQSAPANPAPVFPAVPVPVQTAPNPPATPPSYATNPPSFSSAPSNPAPVVPTNYGGVGQGIPNGNATGQVGGFQGSAANPNNGYAGGQSGGIQGNYANPNPGNPVSQGSGFQGGYQIPSNTPRVTTDQSAAAGPARTCEELKQ